MNELLIDGFIKSANNNREKTCLEIGEDSFSYHELHKRSSAIAAVVDEKSPYVAILSIRNIDTYAGIIGTLLAGKAYLPLHRKFPVQRVVTMLQQAGCKTIIVGDDSLDYFNKLQPFISSDTTIIFPNKCKETSLFQPEITNPNSCAYLLFTSGSTGIPKGVPVSNRNAVSYIKYIVQTYSIRSTDRISQTFDTTFDPSVHDIFTAFFAGACLCVVPETDLMAPAKFIVEKKLSIWYSVPSIAGFLMQMHLLKHNKFPNLRWTFFSAEVLLSTIVEDWQIAAPNSKIVNFYGPTEVTINVTEYIWDNITSINRSAHGAVPIGWRLPHVETLILDDDGTECSEGELYLGGVQLTTGYINNREKTKLQFIKINEKNWFKTGDIVIKDRDDCLHFVGRTDDQIKIRGFRVELEEINHRIREITKTPTVITIPIREKEKTITSLRTFIEGPAVDTLDIIDYCKQFLPEYMIPTEIIFYQHLPRNSNGKIDKNKLINN